MNTTEVVLVSVSDGTDVGEHLWQVSYMGALSPEGEVCSGGGVSRVSLLDGQQEEYCEDWLQPSGTEDGVLTQYRTEGHQSAAFGRGAYPR